MLKSKVLPKEKLEKLSVPRLIAYLRRINKCLEEPLLDWGFDYGDSNPHLTKKDPEWKAIHEEIKSIIKKKSIIR